MEKNENKNIVFERSLRYKKSTGDFGEYFIMHWLNKRNFEVVLIDYVGIDLIAHNKNLNKSYGISVKTRLIGQKRKKVIQSWFEHLK